MRSGLLFTPAHAAHTSTLRGPHMVLCEPCVERKVWAGATPLAGSPGSRGSRARRARGLATPRVRGCTSSYKVQFAALAETKVR